MIAGVVPCAGASARMGKPKALLSIRGRTFVQAVVDALSAGGCEPVVSVVPDDELIMEAARAGGLSNVKIVLHHIVPNLLGVVAVYVTLTIPQVILVESFLSFLGLGVQEPMTSWGALVNEGAQEMETAPWMLIFPATFLATTLFCLNFIGDGLRDALDPRDRSN